MFLIFLAINSVVLGFLTGSWQTDYLQEHGLFVSGYITMENVCPLPAAINSL